jgi:PAS domain S-box-containing protein
VSSSPVHILDATSLSGGPGNAAALLAGLLDSAMDAIITIDERQMIVLYNRAAIRIFGWARDEMLGQPLERLIPGRFRPAHGEHVERFGTTGVSSRKMGGLRIVYGLRSSGVEFPMDASISQLDTPQGKLYTVILRDITERLQAEERHARLAARLTGLLESAMDAIITVDEQQRVVLYNRAAEKVFGFTSEQVLGGSLEKLMPARYQGRHFSHVKQFDRTGTTSRRMGDGTVIYGLRASGEEFPMEASISQLDSAEGKLFTVILRDVSERVRAQEELSTFAAEAHTLREGEKSRIARELHDELAQSLTALKMDTIWLRDNAPAEPEKAVAKLAEMVSMLDTTVAATRRIAADLRPLLLDDLGLAPAIDWLAHTFTQRTGVPCHVSVDEDLELEEPYATAVFRIVQESLANVGKHARASEASVVIARTANAVTLEVRDNGQGFSTVAPRKPHSLGLMGLRERAHLLKGTVVLDSLPGKGTRVQVLIPVQDSGTSK